MIHIGLYSLGSARNLDDVSIMEGYRVDHPINLARQKRSFTASPATNSHVAWGWCENGAYQSSQSLTKVQQLCYMTGHSQGLDIK